jgi:hypothetical protein
MYIQLTLEYVFMHLKIIWQMYLKSLIHKNTIVPLHVCIVSVALFTKILTIKNCCKCKTKIKKSFTKIFTIILSVKIVLILRVKLPYRKCKIFDLKRNICLIFYRKWKKRWTMHWRFGLKIREQFTVNAFSLTVWQTSLHILINVYWNKYGLIQTDATNEIVVYSFLAWLITEYNDAFHAFTFSMQQSVVKTKYRRTSPVKWLPVR